jgi:hypothetical protein
MATDKEDDPKIINANLSRALANRLQEKIGKLGSPLFQFHWEDRFTPEGRLVPVLVASRRRIVHTDSTTGEEVILKPWPTPQARDWKGPQGRWKKLGALDLPAAASLVVGAEKGMKLNPAFSLWLMGLPPAWDECGTLVEESMRRRRREARAARRKSQTKQKDKHNAR